MYSLLSGLWKYLFQKDEFFVLILGLDNAGKTTFLEQTKTKFNKGYKGMNLAKVTTTVGLNIGKIDLGKARLNFWDLGGQEELQSLWDKYYAETHAVIYVVDSSDRDRIEESKTAFGGLKAITVSRNVLTTKGVIIDRMVVNSSLSGVPLLLLANKQDLESCLTVSDVQHVFNPTPDVVGYRDCRTDAVSALRGDGVQESISWLADCIKRNTDSRPPTQRDIT